MNKIVVYALTTCPHCKRVIEFLKKSEAEFEVIWLDELKGGERRKAIEEVRTISGSYAVPVVVKGEKYVLGYNLEKLKGLIT